MKYEDLKTFSIGKKTNIIIGNKPVWDMYNLELVFKDGTIKIIKVFTEHNESDTYSNYDEQKKEGFFVKRLFGPTGLFVKENREDYIFLGRLENREIRWVPTRHYTVPGENVEAQTLFDQHFPFLKNTLERYTYEDYYRIIQEATRYFNRKYGTNFEVIFNKELPDGINKNNGGGYDNKSGKIYLYYDTIADVGRTADGKDKGLTFLLYALFHELRHGMQWKRITELNSPIEGVADDRYQFMIETSKLFIFQQGVYPEKCHDQALFEIDADYVGLQMAKEFVDYQKTALEEERKKRIKNNQPQYLPGERIYYDDIDFNYYNGMERYTLYRYQSYDEQYYLNAACEILQRYPDILKYSEYRFSNSLVREFFNKNGTLKDVTEIMNDYRICNGNQEILKAFMSCNQYIDGLSRMSETERNFVLRFALETLNKSRRRTAKVQELKPTVDIDFVKYYMVSKSRPMEGFSSYKTLAIVNNDAYYEKLRRCVEMAPSWGRKF